MPQFPRLALGNGNTSFVVDTSSTMLSAHRHYLVQSLSGTWHRVGDGGGDAFLFYGIKSPRTL